MDLPPLDNDSLFSGLLVSIILEPVMFDRYELGSNGFGVDA